MRFAACLLMFFLAGCGGKDKNVYPTTPSLAYARLMAAPIKSDPHGIFGLTDVVTDGDQSRQVRWYGYSVGTDLLCVADITPEGSGSSRLMVHCNLPNNEPAAGMAAAHTRSAMIEHIDAALTGRPFDPARADGMTVANWPFSRNARVTSAGWPSDPNQPDGSVRSAIAEVTKPDAQVLREVHAKEKIAAEVRANALPPPYPAPSQPSDFTRPMISGDPVGQRR